MRWIKAALFIAAIVFVVKACAPDAQKGRVVERNSEDVSVTLRTNKVVFSRVGVFNKEYRVFGLTPNTDGNSFLSHIDFFAVMVPLDTMRAMGKEACELNANPGSNVVDLMVPDVDIKRKMIDLFEHQDKNERFALRLKGAELREKQHEFDGHVLNPDGNADTCLMVTDVELAHW